MLPRFPTFRRKVSTRLILKTATPPASRMRSEEHTSDLVTGVQTCALPICYDFILLPSAALDQLQQEAEANEASFLNLMIQALTAHNDRLQGWLNDGVGILNFGGVKIDASRFALPEVATNAEDAAKAVADGGAWSVDAVAGRIFDLATAIAGNDPEKLATMRAAVEEGFKQAGATWKSATGLSDMPDITQRTYNELMHRFDNFGNANE